MIILLEALTLLEAMVVYLVQERIGQGIGVR